MQRPSVSPCCDQTNHLSSVELPIIYDSDTNTAIIEAITNALTKPRSSYANVKAKVTLPFVKATPHRMYTLYFELGRYLSENHSNYRLLDFTLEPCDLRLFVLTYTCRHIGLADFALKPPKSFVRRLFLC